MTSTLVVATVRIPSTANAEMIWFAPRNQPPIAAPDFMNLFKINAPWEKAADKIRVFKLYPQFVDSASDSDLKLVIVGLRRLKMEMAIEYGMVDYTSPVLCSGPPCGNIEGQGGQNLDKTLARIRRLGGRVTYIAMDEPLWFGHVITKAENANATEASIEVLASNVARQVVTAQKYFPSVRIGDIEPLAGESAPASYLAQTRAWIKAYQSATGRPLDFYDADVLWHDSGWDKNLVKMHFITQQLGIRFGVIYNGDPNDPTGRAWTDNALRRARLVSFSLKLHPDDVIFQSWMEQPKYALPETTPGTMTGLVVKYVATMKAPSV